MTDGLTSMVIDQNLTSQIIYGAFTVICYRS
jgi:hypothetical protein